MSAELICPKHGPYSASLGSCPYCNGGSARPQQPTPLDADDNLPTQIGYHAPVRGGAPAAGWSQDDAPTELPAARRSGRRILDDSDDEKTNLGRLGRDDETEIEFKPTGAQAILWVKEGVRRGRIYKLQNETLIGRKDGGLILDDPKVSNPHAKITCEDGQYFIWDFASKNGTFVNGERIRAATAIKENDVIKMGDYVFVLKVLE